LNKQKNLKPETKVDDLSDVSEKVKRRIDKLTFKVREAERREKAAIDYAQSIKKELDNTNTRFSKTSKSYIEQFSARVSAEQEKAKTALRDAIAEQDADKIAEANSRIAQLAVEAEKVKMTAAEEEAKEEK
jgi:outer membrane murein-binding lipoprotein Lpp